MNINLLASLIGVFMFVTTMYFVFRYANGKWKVSESKKQAYLEWVNYHGETVKKSIVVISIIYGIAMIIQLSSFI